MESHCQLCLFCSSDWIWCLFCIKLCALPAQAPTKQLVSKVRAWSTGLKACWYGCHVHRRCIQILCAQELDAQHFRELAVAFAAGGFGPQPVVDHDFSSLKTSGSTCLQEVLYCTLLNDHRIYCTLYASRCFAVCVATQRLPFLFAVKLLAS